MHSIDFLGLIDTCREISGLLCGLSICWAKGMAVQCMFLGITIDECTGTLLWLIRRFSVIQQCLVEETISDYE